jgi:hypothetical protein
MTRRRASGRSSASAGLDSGAPVTEDTLRELVTIRRSGEYHVPSIVRLTTKRLEEELRRLEHAHGMSSAEFYRRFQAGEIPEGRAFSRWVWLCTLAIGRGLLSPMATRVG